MNLNEQHPTRIENQEGDVRQKLIRGKNAHEVFMKAYYKGAYVGWTVEYFTFNPQTEEYKIMLKFANQ